MASGGPAPSSTDGARMRTEPTTAPWDEVGPRREHPPRSASPVVGLVIGIAVVAFLVWRGHPTLAGVLLVVVVAVTAARRLSPTFDRSAGRVLHAVSHGAGVALTWVVFVPFTLLVVTPVWFVLRATRWDPLGPSRGRRGRWAPRSRRRRREFPERLYTDEREEGRRWSTTVHGALAGLACCALGAAVALGAYEAVSVLLGGTAGETSTAAAGGANGLAPTLPAWQHFEIEPWSEALAQGEYQTTPRYDAILTWRNTDALHTQYVNIVDGARATYRPTFAAGADPVQVWFFGGSAAFGYNQRDDHTIASDLARLAEQDGMPVEITNFGTVAYTNWQETVLLGELLTERPPPDLIVFYDGMNDLTLYLGLDAPTRPSQMFGAAIETLLAQNHATLDFPVDPASGAAAVGEPTVAAGVYNQGVELSHRIGAAYGIDVATFYQPSIYTTVGPVDPRVLDVTGMSEEEVETQRARWEEARRDLDPRVIDVAGSLDGVEGTLFYDWVHHNERAAELIAESMYETLGPQLRALQAGREATAPG